MTDKKEPLRVAQIIGTMEHGGIEAVIMNYYRSMDRSRVQFDFFICTPHAPQEAEILALGGRVFHLPPYRKAVSYYSCLKSLLRRGNYKVVHANLNTINWLPLCAAKAAGVPVRICHNHSTAQWGEKKTLLKYLMRPFAPLAATQKAACGACAAEWMYGSEAVKARNVLIVPNAVDLQRFTFSAQRRAAARAALHLENTYVVGNIGRFVYQKNHTFLLEAFACLYQKMPEARLLLIGEGGLEVELHAKAAALGVAEDVIFAGTMPDTADSYLAMDVFCLPSHYEGMPVVAIEAQASGLPCLFSTDVSREAAICGNAAFLPLSDGAEAWADALARLRTEARTDEHAADDLAAAGFDIHKAAQRLASCYENEVGHGIGAVHGE